ncbi:MAG: protein-L-isoaspartate(D-aspartate) O-methyltransferase [Saprospiraceae bacterium]
MKWLCTLCLPIMILAGLSAQDSYEKSRSDMVARQIKARGVSDAATLAAMKNVKRHLFVPESYRASAYEDRPLPIGYGQTISQPYMVAFMTEVIEPKPDFKVLEIGTGSGYQAAVLAEIVDMVYTIEIVEALGKQAQARLAQLGYDNVVVRIGDGYHGWEEAGPFNAIVVTAGAGSIPSPLVKQLKEGGKMVIPVGDTQQVQNLMLVEKKGGKTTTKTLFPVRFVPFVRE